MPAAQAVMPRKNTPFIDHFPPIRLLAEETPEAKLRLFDENSAVTFVCVQLHSYDLGDIHELAVAARTKTFDLTVRAKSWQDGDRLAVRKIADRRPGLLKDLQQSAKLVAIASSFTFTLDVQPRESNPNVNAKCSAEAHRRNWRDIYLSRA
ncbi:hypothetical protein BDW22DRAFT_1482649 [Trametopsis cervina]|nr:hypothetical protein BDW22DRAFT_1482649 [Trametopsis cervina]